MASDTWFSEIESTIFTVLQYNLVEREDAPFPSLNCTTSSQNESLENVSDFPTMYVHLLPAVSIGDDLEQASVNAINATFQIEVYSNKSESQCIKIMNAVIDEMNKLHFRVPSLPDAQTVDKKYYAIARFNRVIGSGDTDIVAE